MLLAFDRCRWTACRHASLPGRDMYIGDWATADVAAAAIAAAAV